MTLSSNVLKAWTVRKGGDPVRLTSGSNGEVPSVERAVADAKEAARDVVIRAQEEARAIIEGAEEEAAQIRDKARSQGYEEGIRRGIEDGRDTASKEWLRISTQTSAVLSRIEQLQAYTQVLDTELVLAQAASLCAKFIDEEAKTHPEQLRSYLTSLLENLEEDQITLFLSEEFHTTLQGLTRNWGSSWERVQLAVDWSLQELQMRIETQDGENFVAGPLAALSRILDEVLYGSP